MTGCHEHEFVPSSFKGLGWNKMKGIISTVSGKQTGED
jgi:hypothetical protein